MTNGNKFANELHFAVKGHLIPLSWSEKSIQQMVNQYTKRLWGNHERLVYCNDNFEKLWKEHNG